MSLSVIVIAGVILFALIIFTLNQLEKYPPPKHEDTSSEPAPATVPDTHVSTQTVSPSLAAPVLARWTIRYRSIDATTTRTVRITRVHPRKHQIVGWCELRNQERTFSLFAIEEARDATTGEILDLNEWMTAYRRSRRSSKKKI